jgi:hypothetical protein
VLAITLFNGPRYASKLVIHLRVVINIADKAANDAGYHQKGVFIQVC